MIASVCERAAGGSCQTGGGGPKPVQQQSSQDQSVTTAMVRETLRKNSIITSPLSTSQTSVDIQLKPTTPTASNSGPSMTLQQFDTFDKTTAQCEAEEQLELLMMQEEMSELRIAAQTDSHITLNEPSTSTSPTVNSISSSGGDSALQRVSVYSQLTKSSSQVNTVPNFSSSSNVNILLSDGDCSGGGCDGVISSGVSGVTDGVHGGVIASTAGQVDVRSQQLTIDSKEKERLDDIMAVAQ